MFWPPDSFFPSVMCLSDFPLARTVSFMSQESFKETEFLGQRLNTVVNLIKERDRGRTETERQRQRQRQMFLTQPHPTTW